MELKTDYNGGAFISEDNTIATNKTDGLGCEHCSFFYKKQMQLPKQDGTREWVDLKYCPLCGKPLEVNP